MLTRAQAPPRNVKPGSHLTGGPLARHAGDPAVAAMWIGGHASAALYRELALSPKPGLVSFVDSGSHTDMDATTFLRSIGALRGYFPEMVMLGRASAPFARLEQAGLAAEAAMCGATGGINTHRGAIFMLGLLCAAAGRIEFPSHDPAAWQKALLAVWGESLAARAGTRRKTAATLRDAGVEAALGFPIVFNVACPAWRRAESLGLDDTRVRLQVLFECMAVLDDTNLFRRGGSDGLRFAQRSARDFLQCGGAVRPDALAHAQSIHAQFVARRLSPGGSADVLAAADLIATCATPR